MKNDQTPINDHDYPKTLAFAPELLHIRQSHPSPLPRMVLLLVLGLLAIMIVWACFGRLDVVAVAEGKLIPVSYLKIVQPAESGIVREIAVMEGQHVQAGQILVRMDANVAQADSKSIQQTLQLKQLELRRIKAELNNLSFNQQKGDNLPLYQSVLAEYLANRRALEDNLSAEQASYQKAEQDLAASLEIQHKLEQVLPSYQAQEDSYQALGKKGFAGQLMVDEKKRERIEKEQDLKAQQYNGQSLKASMTQSQKRIAQIKSAYRQKLEAEHVTTLADAQKLEQEWAKQSHKNSLLELKAPQAGIIKDLATHTPGTVVSPGTVLMTLVPSNEALQAEVWLKNEDAGFVQPNQSVKVKLSAYPFQKYGMVDGKVLQVSADATDRGTDNQANNLNTPSNASNTTQLAYRTIVQLNQQHLQLEQDKLRLAPGMQVMAEIKLADQTVMEYLLSPVRKAFHEAARER